MTSRVKCFISGGGLRRNYAYLKQCARSCRLMPVLKYDAYGLGAHGIGGILKDCGAYRFAVANAEEALDILDLGLDVQILGILPESETAPAVEAGIICPVCQISAARSISDAAVKSGRTARVAVKLDTGMGRLGFDPEKDLDLIAEAVKLPGLQLDGIFSHYSTAGEPDAEYAAYQSRRFKDAVAKLAAAGINFPHIHHAAGDAIAKIPESTEPPFNLARPGGIMYGEDFVSPCRQIITLTARVGAVRKIAPGGSIGYFRTFQAAQETAVAVLEAGYADGIPLALSNRGAVLLHGKRCPILGRVSMDYTVVDISAVPETAAGDEAILLGRDGDEAITVHDWAEMKKTHSHDIWCSIGHRVKRIYTE